MKRLIVVDYGSQYSFLIARRLRNEVGVWCEIIGPKALKDVTSENTFGVILSGGPKTVEKQPSPDEERVIKDEALPVLGICYGMQLIARSLGGTVAKSRQSEFGPTTVTRTEKEEPLFYSCFEKERLQPLLPDSDAYVTCARVCRVLMSHNDTVQHVPEAVITSTSPAGVASFRSDRFKCWGVQWHPEVNDTHNGSLFLKEWVKQHTMASIGSWNSKTRLERCLQVIRDTVSDDDRIVLGLSGGVDSMTCAALLRRALRPDQWRAVLVDHGMMRRGEVEEVQTTCAGQQIPLITRCDSSIFLETLSNTVDPEHKRSLIGTLFISSFKDATHNFKPTVLAQGTIYPDVVESGLADNSGDGSEQHVIKSHHNVGGLPKELNLKILEPLRWLFKDEVRQLGLELGLPLTIINRHPFPGPGLAIRILGGPITREKIEVLQQADAIFIRAIKQRGIYNSISQAYAALMDVKAVGVVGDQRREGYVIVLRAVVTDDFMTARSFPFTADFLETISTQIVNQCGQVTRVMLDTTPKPPGTIELQ